MDGTSFSAPRVAGAAALLKSARPGLTVEQYRSLLINTATPVNLLIHQAGSGVLNAGASLAASVTANPSALNFGAGASTVATERTLRLTNSSTAAEAYSITVTNSTGGMTPWSSVNTVEIARGASIDVTILWQATSLNEGAHQGFIEVRGSSGNAIRVPWWYAVSSSTPAGITVLQATESGRRNSTQRNAILFRVNNAAGLPITDADVRVVVVSGDGTAAAVRSLDSDVPGMFSVQVRLGPAAGANVFRIEAGSASADVTITGN